jgi:hypothetical protein
LDSEPLDAGLESVDGAGLALSDELADLDELLLEESDEEELPESAAADFL